jgi:sulfatase modifying factor 1
MRRSAIPLGLLTLLVGCSSLLGIDDADFVAGDGGVDDATTSDASSDASRDTAVEGASADAMSAGGCSCDASAPFCVNGACAENPPSCQPGGPGMTNCGALDDGGASGTESCCTSPVVMGGAFYRSYDGVTYMDMSNPAQVSDLRLDKYEVTVGRFRRFVSAVEGGWTPTAGSGKHTYLNGGKGLTGAPTDAGDATHENGWSTSWNATLATTADEWNTNLACGSTATWTPIAVANENKPIGCMTWYEAYAFCIWDGAFLPSEAEWNYAASGGGEQRVYPWSNPPSSSVIDCSYANYLGGNDGNPCVAAGANDVGSESPKGDTSDDKWGQADMAGNVYEWDLDFMDTNAPTYINPCVDCADLSTPSTQAARGGSFVWNKDKQLAAMRNNASVTSRWLDVGVRCARTR